MILKREMAISRNIYVNPPEADKSSELLVRRTTEYASAQFLDFLDLAKNSSFPALKYLDTTYLLSLWERKIAHLRTKSVSYLQPH